VEFLNEKGGGDFQLFVIRVFEIQIIRTHGTHLLLHFHLDYNGVLCLCGDLPEANSLQLLLSCPAESVGYLSHIQFKHKPQNGVVGLAIPIVTLDLEL
jgi:hypothetical protein